MSERRGGRWVLRIIYEMKLKIIILVKENEKNRLKQIETVKEKKL